MEQFSTQLEYRVVVLHSAAEVVRFSFIVRNSISYLDLELSQHWRSLNNVGTSCDSCASKLSKSFTNTEEKCRKLFAPSRSLLYTLHLDLPKERESSLKNVTKYVTNCLDSGIPHIGKITPFCGFDVSIVSDFINDATDIYNEKQKILAWILKVSNAKLPLLDFLEIEIVNKFIDCNYPEITDPIIFKDFIMHFDFREWVSTYEKPEILEYLLYYARYYWKRDLTEGDFLIDEIIDSCIFNCHFLNIGPILKYINVPIFTDDDYWLYYDEISSMSSSFTIEVLDALEETEKWMKRERVHQMLQIIWIHIDCKHHHRVEAASEALRLIWCSVPDAYISFEEIKTAFLGVDIEELKNIYDFYAKSVGKFYERVEPRSLQHLCRSTIRETLRENQIWIPDGLSQTGLPKSLQQFLNLEKSIYHH